MAERYYCGRLASIKDWLNNLHIPLDSFALLEREPQRWENDNSLGVQLIAYHDKLDPDFWTRGRLFNSDFEISWQRDQDNQAWLVSIIGCYEAVPDLPISSIDLTNCQVEQKTYFLWGQRLARPEIVGLQNNQPAYLEVQIPRVLLYPVAGPGHSVVIKVKEYYSQSTGEMVGYRFYGLEEIG